MTTIEWIKEFISMYWWPIIAFSIFGYVKIRHTFRNKEHDKD